LAYKIMTWHIELCWICFNLYPTLFEVPSQLLRFHVSCWVLLPAGRVELKSVVCDRTWLATTPVSILSRFAGAIPCLPRREHNHHPSRPPVSCSSTVMTSPRLNDSSSPVSASLSNNALARSRCCKRNKRNN